MKPSSFCLLPVFSLFLVACDPSHEGFKSGDPSAGSPGDASSEPAVSKAEFDALLARVTALETSLTAINGDTSRAISSLDQRLDAEEAATPAVAQRLVQVEALAAPLAEIATTTDAHTAQLADHEALLGALVSAANTLPELQDAVSGLLQKTQFMSLGVDAGGLPTVFFTGVNLHLRNGKSDDSSDGTGNLVLGQNGFNGGVVDRTGSHNLILGNGHSYRGNGNVLVGENLTVGGGGRNNLLVGENHTVATNANRNVLFGAYSSASGNLSSVLGGRGNGVGGNFSTVLGGTNNSLGGWRSTHLGGANRTSPTSDTIVPLWDSGMPKT